MLALQIIPSDQFQSHVSALSARSFVHMFLMRHIMEYGEIFLPVCEREEAKCYVTVINQEGYIGCCLVVTGKGVFSRIKCVLYLRVGIHKISIL